MLNGAAAQHADLDRVVEQHEIDRSLQRGGRPIVLGIEEFGVEERNVTGLAFALGLGLAEVDHAGLVKRGHPLEGLAFGSEHRVDQMHAAALVGEHLRDEQTLLQLATEFGALLHERALGIDLFAAGQ